MSISVFDDKLNPPTTEDISEVLGPKNELWKAIETHIENLYKLKGEPKYYSKSSGWVIWFRKSGKTVVTMFPHKNDFDVLFILGQKQFDAAMRSELNPEIKNIIANTKQYHDGRWFFIHKICDGYLNDIYTLMNIKTASDKKLQCMFMKEEKNG